ncbi:hypothetical protein MUN81_15390 [Hymenobacter sp. 5317J-9]|nr:hypothetical protein [Hymenobacter sp. 5317J-9]UOQ96619.1 hypothetical protein MUN81_15390 [Hymenobacter sp. 5317J-9]
MGYDDDDMHPLLGTALMGAVMAGLFFLARLAYRLPWAHWWHWLTTW